jgi:hypothetical protein
MGLGVKTGFGKLALFKVLENLRRPRQNLAGQFLDDAVTEIISA